MISQQIMPELSRSPFTVAHEGAVLGIKHLNWRASLTSLQRLISFGAAPRKSSLFHLLLLASPEKLLPFKVFTFSVSLRLLTVI